jgi:Tetratricopeptide repeat
VASVKKLLDLACWIRWATYVRYQGSHAYGKDRRLLGLLSHCINQSVDMNFSSSNISKKGAQESPEATLSPTSVVTTPSSTSSTRHDGNCSNNHSDNRSTTTTLPGTVAMVQSASFASLLPSGAASVANDASTSVMQKPFFVMDWLEDINPRDLELARQMLQTPTKKRSTSLIPSPVMSHQLSSRRNSQESQQDRQRHQRRDSSPSTRSNINLPTLDRTREEPAHSSICRRLFSAEASSRDQASTASTETPGTPPAVASPVATPKTTAANQPLTPPAQMSPFRKRSIAIGNGWNAKGLHKAKRGSWESALTCWENALVIRSQVLGESHPDVANTCNNIGIALGKQGRYDAAIEMLEKALELRAKHYGTRKHASVAATLHNIGNVLHAARDYAGAIQCFWDAKLLQEQLLGPNHIQVARACVAIANVYNEAFQYLDAREAYLDALKTFQGAGLPEDDPEVVGIRVDLQEVEHLCAGQLRQQHHSMYQHQQYHWRQRYPAMTANGD